MSDTYIPGQCNIGKVEVRRRIRNGFIGLSIAFLCLLVVEVFDLSRPFRWLVFPGLFYGVSGFVQARMKFCYLYGWYGLVSMTGRKQLHRTEREFAGKDRSKAIKMLLLILLVSLIFTVVYVIV